MTWDEDGARALAAAADAAFAAGLDHGPLQGVPVSVKDIYGAAGYPTFAGSPKRLPAAWEKDGAMVSALRRSSAVISGKTHTVEFAFGGLGVNSHWETPRNPWDGGAHRVPGGSSAGAGVSLIEGSAFVAFGSDTGGSVRIPASFTGNVGIKVTIGRWPTSGIVPLSHTYDTPGILVRTVADLAFAFAALDPLARGYRDASPAVDPADVSGVRIGVTKDFFWDDLSPGIGDRVTAAIEALGAAGAHVVSIPFPEPGALGGTTVGSIAGAEVHAFLSEQLPEWLETLDPVVAPRIHAGGETTADEYLIQRRRAAELARAANARLAEVDVVAVPTTAVTPPKLADIGDLDAYREVNIKALRNTIPGNLLELCAITMPVGLDEEGMPVGMQLLARGHSEERLIAVALAAERILGTSAERLGRPPLGGAG
jgi:aspartyl-tRNA(Asn)/glutamyl-tRNA(Gln) amidotransferase subunit A